MSHQFLLGLTAVAILGISAQWLAWRFRFPSILLLLVLGLLAGPVTGLLHPDALLGELLLPIVSLSVAIILFEGGLNLRIRELPHIGNGLVGLVTVGLGITAVLTALAARVILGMETQLAVLVGAVLVVTGPTVILPLLRHVRPRGNIASLIKWEGILNDPVGVMLAVLVFEVIVAGGWHAGRGALLAGMARTVLTGAALGLAAAAVMVVLLRRYQLPEYLESPFTLMMVLLAYTASDLVQKESGLLTVTLMGFAMANQRFVVMRRIVEFKESLTVLLLSFLFIVLAARLEPESLRLLSWRSIVFLAVLILVIRPAAVFLGTSLAPLTWRERVFVSWMAPRGVVAAASASFFAFRLEELGHPGARELVPLVFLVIVGTVALYGLTALPLARRLDVYSGQAQGCLIVGAHRLARKIGRALGDAGFRVMLVDTDGENVMVARMEGLDAQSASVLGETLADDLPTDDLGKLLALTSSPEVNSLAALHFAELFGRQEVYQLALGADPEEEKEILRSGLRGRTLFRRDVSCAWLEEKLEKGAVIKAMRLTEQFGYEDFRLRYGPAAVPLFAVDNGTLEVATADKKFSPRPGQTLIALVAEGATG